MIDPASSQPEPGPFPLPGRDRSEEAFRDAAQAGLDAEAAGSADAPGETDALFRHLADTAPVLIWLSGLDKRCFWFNKPWLEFTGRTLAQEYGDGWTEGIHPDDYERCLRVYATSFDARKPFKMEYRLRRHDGQYRWLLGHGVPRFSHDGEFIGFIGSCIDITRRREAENRLRISEENLTALVQATSQVVWTADLNGMSQETRQFWENLTGQTAAESHEWGWLDAVHPADRDQTRAAWDRAYEEKRQFKARCRVLNREKRYLHFSVQGVPVLNDDGSFRLWIGTLTDITDRVEAETALRRSETRLRMLVESATEFAIFTIGEDGLIKSWSVGAERIFGYGESEILGQPAALLFLPQDRAAGVPGAELETARSEGHALDERWHVRKDGNPFFASGAVSPIRGTEPLEFVKIARDLTHRKEMEDALKDADRRKNEFLATVAHELRNPLAPIRSGIDLIKRSDYDRRMTKRTLEVIERQTDQIVHLVDDLLDISRITQGKIRLQRERLDLRRLIRQAVEGSRDAIRLKEHRLSVSLPEHPVMLEADATRIEQVLLNLLGNAAKYTPSRGEIRIAATVEDSEAVIRVVDNGVGIPAEKLDEVFAIFSQVHDPPDGSDNGLGIGLSVVRGLVNLHGGSVIARSAGVGKGSEFIVRLPLAETESGTAKSDGDRSFQAPESLGPGKRVLVVDDNRDAVSMLQILLTMDGHEVRVAYDGEEAVREAEAFRPDVCLCDLGLPKLDGFEVARRISASLPETLLVAVSGWGQDEDRRRSREAGFHHHFVKPVRVEEVTPLLE